MTTMYSEWVSLRHDLRADKGNRSVLGTFPRPIGRDIAHTVAKTFLQEQTIGDRNRLNTAAEVDWVMEVFCYGLALPMTEADGEVIKGCVNTYIDWLSVLLMDEQKQGIPAPLIQEPVKYIRKIFQHLKNLFLIRVDDGSNLALQASLCIRVLQFFKVIASECVLSAEIWDAILRLMLVINEQLLSPPYTPGGLCDHLREILILSLLEVWLYASIQYFPPPSMWKTLQEMCMSWRHHNAMIEYWSNTSLMLTRKAIKHLYGNSFSLPSLKTKKNNVLIPPTMAGSTLLQCWFRILHIIGNPVDLCNKELISDTPKFKEFALSCQDVTYPSAHPCLDCLPQIFLHAMKGIAAMVNMFLNVTTTHEEPVMHTAISAPKKGSSPSSSKKREVKTLSTGLALGLGEQRGLGMRSLTMPSRHSSGTTMTSIASQDDLDGEKEQATPASALFSKFPISVTSPSVDSLLDLYGSWLFEAAFGKLDMAASYDAIAEVYNKCYEAIDEEVVPPISPRKVSVESSSSLLKRDFTDDSSFEPGRAEAYGVLCRIFCSPRSEQTIRPVYLSRFYLAIAIGLVHDEQCTGHVLCSILLNSPDLLRVDLQGVQVLLPHLLAALEIVLSKRNINVLRCPVSITELRRAAIHLLVSMLCLPLHFQSLPIQDMTASYQKKKQPACDALPTETTSLTFLSLKPRITRLLLDALQVESDSYNVQILLGGVSVLVQDTEIAHSMGITQPPAHFPPIQGDKEPPSWVELAARNRTRASTGGSSMMSEASTFMDETEANLTFPKTTNESYDPTTVCGLFVQMTHLLCNKLVVTRSSKWKPDLHVTLAAFEVLSGMAQLSMDYLDPTESQSTIHWLCDYVSLQANKPATHHSRDLHSMIVAAFHCIKTWVMAHPRLLDAEDCLQAVMEVVELGISGSKSKDVRPEQEQENTEPSLKGVKELKPVSFRVRQAAEGLLTCIMEHLGAFPSPCGPSAQSSLLNEESLLEYSKTNKSVTKYDGRFRYFAIRDNSYILGVLEDSLETRDTLPTISSIIRAPTGRHVWTMELRQFSRKKHDLIEAHLTDPGRPMPLVDLPKPPKQVSHRYFPAAVDSVPLTNADRSIPELDDILDNKLSEVQDHMRTLMQKQAEHEAVEQTRVDREKANLRFPSADTESIPLEPCESFRASRLFLSHHGLLSIEGLKGNPDNSSEDPSLVALDSTRHGFRAALEDLDNVPTRNQDTVFVFYVKSGQHEADEIIENEINSCKHNKLFIEFLLSLGWPVDADTHPGWTGNVHKSWIPSDTDTETKQQRSKLERSNMFASSMSTITSSTSTMGHEGDVTPSSDEENWFVRDRFLTQTHKESQDSVETQSDTVTLDDPATQQESSTHKDSTTKRPTSGNYDSPRIPGAKMTSSAKSFEKRTQSESASDVDSVTQVDAGVKAQSKSSINQQESVTQGESITQKETASVTQVSPVTQGATVTQKDPATQQESSTHKDSTTKRPTSGNYDSPRIPGAKMTSSAKSFEKDSNQILYYADISGEIAFVVPALLPQYQRFRKMIVRGESTSDEDTEEADESLKDRPRARSGSMGSLEIKSNSASSFTELRLPLSRQASDGFAAFGSRSRFPEPDTVKPITRPNAHTTSSETSVVVAWLEHFPDHSYFPIDDILVEMDFGNSGTQRGLVDKDTVVIFIHILQNGLYRVHIRSTIKSPIAGPLVDGMVVSRRALGTMVRHTAMHIANRRRLEIDSYSPPSVCRKLKIQDIVKKYRQELPVPEFYVSFFGKEN